MVPESRKPDVVDPDTPKTREAPNLSTMTACKLLTWETERVERPSRSRTRVISKRHMLSTVKRAATCGTTDSVLTPCLTIYPKQVVESTVCCLVHSYSKLEKRTTLAPYAEGYRIPAEAAQVSTNPILLNQMESIR